MPKQYTMNDIPLDVERWVSPEGYFLDPVNGQMLGEDGQYQWLMSDERLQKGRDYLGDIAARLTITALYGNHKAGTYLSDDTESVVAEHHGIGIEVLGWDRALHEVRLGRIPDYTEERRTEIKKTSWQGRLFVAAHDAAIPSFSFDAEAGGSPSERFIIHYLRQYAEAKKRGSLADGPQKLYLAVNNLRESLWPLKLGYELSLCKELLPSADMRIIMAMGVDHRYMTKRLQSYGLDVNNAPPGNEWRTPSSRAFFRCMLTGRVTKDDLAEGAG